MRHTATLLLLFASFSATAPLKAAPAAKPNIIFILADDLGYGQLGSFGQKLIETPNLDRMAREGMRLRQFYAGSTVCAPSRSVLMTGQHTGHTRVRGNGNPTSPGSILQPNDLTVAELLKRAGYATAVIGKWGLGSAGSTGIPTRKGFDYFFGYLEHVHAHNPYPEFLWRNEERVWLKNKLLREGKPYEERGAGMAEWKGEFAPDRFAAESFRWIEEHREEPFFLYWALITPHANNEATRLTGNGQEVPDLGPYKDKPWSEPDKAHAATITRMDADVGRLFDLLKRLGLDEKTLVVFSSDNGHHKEGGNDPELVDANGPLRGFKRDLTEGGIRVPTIARWPGKVPAGSESDHVAYFGDFLATAAELSGSSSPAGLDSVSFAPTLLGQPDQQQKHEFLYWEFHERGTQQAVLMDGHWKALRLRPNAELELYDLSTDLGENTNLAEQKPEVVGRIANYLETARSESPEWPIKEAPAKARRVAR